MLYQQGVNYNTPSSYHAAKSLVLNNIVDMIIYQINSFEDIDNQGLPFDQYDFLFFLDSPLLQKDILSNHETVLFNTLFKACQRDRLIAGSALAGLQKIESVHQYEMILAAPKSMENYPDFINAISYLDEQNKLIVQSTADEIQPPSKLRDNLLISLWSWLRTGNKA